MRHPQQLTDETTPRETRARLLQELQQWEPAERVGTDRQGTLSAQKDKDPLTDQSPLLSLCFAACSAALVTSDSLGPRGRRPARLLCRGMIPARILEWVAISFSMRLPQEHKNHDLRNHLFQGQGEW